MSDKKLQDSLYKDAEEILKEFDELRNSKDFEDDETTVYYDSNGIPGFQNEDLEVPKAVKEWAEQAILGKAYQQDTVSTGLKYDDDKPRLDLVPAKATLETAKVYTFGAKKYDAHNWRKGINYSRLIAAAKRHLNTFEDHTKSDFDHESDLHHLAHAIVNLQMLLEFELTGRIDLDDRYRGK